MACLSSEIELISRVRDLIGGTCNCSPDTYEAAARQAYAEIGAKPPVSDECQCYWLVERTRRHVLYVQMIEYGRQFKCRAAFLQQRFDHFCKIIECDDKKFADFLNSPACPLPVPQAAIDKFVAGAFFVNPAGFVYDQMGNDLTYQSS